MRAELRDSLEFLYPDSVVAMKPRRSMTLDVARNGVASVHILLNDLVKGRHLHVTVKHDGRTVRDAQWYRLIDVPVEMNTGPIGSTEKKGERNRYVTRRAPFRVYDAMEPVGPRAKVTSQTMALRLHVPVPARTRPGKCEYTIEISSGDETAVFRITVAVHKAVIPSAGEHSFPYTNWFDTNQMASRHGLEVWSEGHWRMVRRYADLMHYSRQNTFLIPLDYVFEMVDRRPVLDRKLLRRIVKTFTAAGLHCIEGGHIGCRPKGDWKSTRIEIQLTRNLATSDKGNADLACITGQLMEEIGRNGWHGRWIQHIADEPWHPNAADYRIMTGIVRKYMPGIPIIDATMETGLVGSVDIWCPQLQKYQKHRARFEAQRKLGDKVWFYTCCFPGGPWLNRLLDMELIRPALIGWAAALYNLDGFLHWGFSHWRPDQDPFEQSVVNPSGSFFLPAGDTHIAYPGKGGPWSSLRLEAQREGFEDYELLQELRRHDPRRSNAVIREVITAFNKYTKDTGVLRAARRRMMSALSKYC